MRFSLFRALLLLFSTITVIDTFSIRERQNLMAKQGATIAKQLKAVPTIQALVPFSKVHPYIVDVGHKSEKIGLALAKFGERIHQDIERLNATALRTLEQLQWETPGRPLITRLGIDLSALPLRGHAFGRALLFEIYLSRYRSLASLGCLKALWRQNQRGAGGGREGGQAAAEDEDNEDEDEEMNSSS